MLLLIAACADGDRATKLPQRLAYSSKLEPSISREVILVMSSPVTYSIEMNAIISDYIGHAKKIISW